VRQHGTQLLALALFVCGGCAERRSIAPVSVSVSGGNQQTVGAAQMLLGPLAAKVSAADGRGVPNVTVEFRVIAGTGRVDSVNPRTNGAGIATTRLRVGSAAGHQDRVVALLVDSVTGALIDTALFTATVTAGAPAKIVGLSGSAISVGLAGPAISMVGQKRPEPMRVLVTDVFDNPVSGVPVTWLVASGKGTLATTKSVSNAQGIAENSVTRRQADEEVVVYAKVAGLPSTVVFGRSTRSVEAAATPPPVQSGAATRPVRLTTLSGAAFGLAVTPGGHLLTTLSSAGRVQNIPIANPGNSPLITVEGWPVVIATDAAGRFAYATNMRGSLLVIDVASASQVASVPIPGEAHSLAVSPRGNRVYVTNTDNSVFAVDVATRRIVGTASVGAGPWGITFWTSEADSLMYVTARNGGSISEVDMRTDTVRRTFPIGGRPHGIAISHNGSTLFVADDSRGEIVFVDRISGAATRRIPEAGAFDIALAPDGRTLYVTTNAGYFVVVDVSSATITKRYEVGGQPRQVVVMPDGGTAMAANMGGWIDVVTR
jgi:YVTN family beta-propeller protein